MRKEKLVDHRKIDGKVIHAFPAGHLADRSAKPLFLPGHPEGVDAIPDYF